MSFTDRLKNAAAALMGYSGYESPGYGPRLDDKTVETIQKSLGGNLQPLPTTKLRWYLEDLEAAQASADNGFMQPASLLCTAMRRDGVMKGLLNSRTKGLVRLPKRFYGDSAIAGELRSKNTSRSVFDEMFPPGELELLDADGIQLGIGVAYMQPVEGRAFPTMVRLNPEFLQYRWNENRWYFNSIAGALPIEPGNGRWILHVPGGRLTPWQAGLWPALGRAFINKEHAIMYRANYCAKLANPARLAYAPQGATEAQRTGFLRKLIAWGVNTCFELPPGWDAKLLESNGRGFEVFQKQIDTSDLEYMVQLAGQIVTTTGGMGFSNADVPAAIRQDLIQGDGEGLSYTINTQGIPSYIVLMHGEEALNRPCIVEWDTGTPTDKEKETRVLGQAADAIGRLTTALNPYGYSVDPQEIGVRFGIPMLEGAVETPETAAADAAAEAPTEATPDASSSAA